MSLGTLALHAILSASDIKAFRELEANLFTPEERPVYDFALAFRRKYGKLPGLKAVKDNGFTLHKGGEKISYYMKRLEDRALFMDLTPDVGALVQAMDNKDMAAARAALAQLSAKARHRDSNDLMTHIGLEAQALLEDMQERGIFALSIPMGFPTLDRATGGLREGELAVLVGRTNMGKSYYLLHMLMSAWRAMHRPLVITMEMEARQLTARMVGMDSGVNPRFIRDRSFSTRGLAAMAEVVTDFQLRPPLTFVSGHKLKDAGDIEALIHETEPDGVWIDAAYLLKLAKKARASKWEMLEEVMEFLQGVCVRTKKPITLTAQMGRKQAIKSTNLENALDNIRGSDAIGQLASVGIAIGPAPGAEGINHRLMRLFKNREGVKDIEWGAKFDFSRMDFSETRLRGVRERQEQRESMI